MTWGWDIETGGTTFCAATEKTELDFTSAVLSFGFGTVPYSQSPGMDASNIATSTTAYALIEAVNEIIANNARSDFKFIRAKLFAKLQQTNTALREYARTVAQGVYAGGVVCCMVGTSFAVLPFGGAAVYCWDGQRFMRQCGSGPEDGMIHDALGCMEIWHGQVWTGELRAGERLFLLSDHPASPGDCASHLETDAQHDSHANTTALLIRHELAKTSHRPCAVLELRNF